MMNTVASPRQPAQDFRFSISDLLDKNVHDKAGKDVARLADLAVGAHGQILSVTLIQSGGTGTKITIPYERLKVAKQDGSLYLETDAVAWQSEAPPSKTAGEGEAIKSQ